jgi:hypothetical protein
MSLRVPATVSPLFHGKLLSVMETTIKPKDKTRNRQQKPRENMIQQLNKGINKSQKG